MASDVSYSATLSPTGTDAFRSHVLSNSISSLASSTSSRPSSSGVSKTYRQASQLFLTRRLPEALSTVQPLITPPAEDADATGHTEPAPVARASRSTRIKVWSLYLTILNAILELEPDEGKDTFGAQEWRALCSKVRDGDVWEEVVRFGYHGVEGDVDSDVVINFGADTPRDLNARVKILELYTLHVLLRNDEWDYAREFISTSSVLDEERREAFLQALQSLQDEKVEAERREREEKQRQDDQLQKDLEEARRLRAENEARERRRIEEERARREGSEVDYGVDGSPNSSGPRKATHPRAGSSAISRPAKSSAAKAKGKAAAQPGIGARAAMILANLRNVIEQMGATFKANPMLLMKLMAFIISFVIMFGKRNIRERIQQTLGKGWRKVKATAGMGVKVSYI
ncbi:hypothetical protein DL769_007095 [Monosporascus sp. CRB-8-3]|nr:hypothetical protein DL769_007095 [Monosporascus sp. CRB-8-3]